MIWSWASPIRILTVTPSTAGPWRRVRLELDYRCWDNAVQVLSDDGMGITWAIPSSALDSRWPHG